MPNWCSNLIKAVGNKDEVLAFGYALIGKPRHIAHMNQKLSALGIDHNTDISTIPNYAEIYEKAYNEALEEVRKHSETTTDKIVTFDVIVPMPNYCLVDKQCITLPNGEPGTVHSQEGWYGWSCTNWGTKWDMCDISLETLMASLKEIEGSEDNDATLYISFNTAWSPPVPFMKAASKKFPNIVFTLNSSEEGGAFFFEEQYINGEINTVFETTDEVEWLIYNEYTIDEILESITWGYDDSWFEGMLDTTCDELDDILKKLRKAYNNETILGSFQEIADELSKELADEFMTKCRAILDTIED